MVLESWYDTRRVVQEFRGAIPGNSQLGIVGIPIPQKAAKEVLEAWNYTRHGRRVVLEAWYYTRHGVGVVLEAWCYTRAAGTEVVHGAMTAQYQRLLGASISKGAVIDTRGSVGDGSDWYTGILVYWYSKHTDSHNIHFAYTWCH